LLTIKRRRLGSLIIGEVEPMGVHQLLMILHSLRLKSLDAISIRVPTIAGWREVSFNVECGMLTEINTALWVRARKAC
jgi:hypothetical protein